MEVTIQFEAKLPLKITQKKHRVVATCPILDVHSQGDTEEQARKNLEEALSLFFVSCFERGVLDAVLKDCGFKAVQPVIQEAQPVSPTEDYISVPIPFLVNRPQKEQYHA